MLFQLVLTKFFKSELFSSLPKVDHVIKSCKEPIVFQINFFGLRIRVAPLERARENHPTQEKATRVLAWGDFHARSRFARSTIHGAPPMLPCAPCKQQRWRPLVASKEDQYLFSIS